jgi:hypothetical protein
MRRGSLGSLTSKNQQQQLQQSRLISNQQQQQFSPNQFRTSSSSSTDLFSPYNHNLNQNSFYQQPSQQQKLFSSSLQNQDDFDLFRYSDALSSSSDMNDQFYAQNSSLASSFTPIPSSSANTFQQSTSLASKLNMRRKTYGPNTLQTVLETGTTSPIQNTQYASFSEQQQLLQLQIHQQQQILQQKLNQLQEQQNNQYLANRTNNTLFSSVLKPQQSSSTAGIRSAVSLKQLSLNDSNLTSTSSGFGSSSQLNLSSSIMNTSNSSNLAGKLRPRAFSMVTASSNIPKPFDLNNNSINNQSQPSLTNQFAATSSLANSTASSLNYYIPPPLTPKVFSDAYEEKLATTGNIFQRRDDWSILSKLPISKQNTVHIRLEDEGPYGNDETRCFVLSHFSSLNIKELNCIFCDCPCVIYDRFPLVDGTLFVSPCMYDKSRSIPAIVSNKQQYINAVCLKCLLGEPEHEIKCSGCSKQWQTIGGSAFQIGTLYKFDLFASLPCCQKRLNCLNCNKNILDYNAVQNSDNFFFSWYSEEKECPNCRIKAYHFIKPLKEIFAKSACETKRDEEMNKENINQE